MVTNTRTHWRVRVRVEGKRRHKNLTHPPLDGRKIDVEGTENNKAEITKFIDV